MKLSRYRPMAVSTVFEPSAFIIAGTGASYTWDARNGLTAIGGSSTAAFHYDPLNRRATAAIGSTTRAFGNAGPNVALEQQGTTVTAQMVPGPWVDERYARATTTGTAGTDSLLSDGLGSVVALADSTGTIQTTHGYDPYGNTTAYAPANDNPYQFTGRENDGTGLYNYRNRYYAPQWDRFISQDPLGFGGGDANVYRYVGGSPVNWRDPFGLCPNSCKGPRVNLGSGFGGILFAFLGASAGGGGQVSIPVSSILNGSFRGTQLTVSGSGTLLLGLGVFAGFGPNFGFGGSMAPAPQGISTSGNLGMQFGVGDGGGIEWGGLLW